MAEHGRRGVVGMGLAGGAALALGGCAPAQEDQSRPSVTPTSDGRFAGFTEYVPVTLEIRTDLGRLDRRMPGVTISSAHWVLQYWQEKREVLPPQDRPIWIHGVMTLDPASTRALAEASSGKADPLPGIYPGLRQYVPEGKVFTTVPKEKADAILDIEHMMQDDPSRFESSSFDTEQVAVCADANLLIFIARERHT
ncbi:hypothetical protein QUV91_07850 [Actinomyces viscosus]|uniref:Lipoprotein n=1 Tax=Actinomyces viscosus TaxID=1656 RepID=A0ABT7TYP6_ACTVI|nr:hypothetical protein [Actinomyces viscosus]MDM8076961.1 hypothetical protein [Actinomyces viscosus]